MFFFHVNGGKYNAMKTKTFLSPGEDVPASIREAAAGKPQALAKRFQALAKKSRALAGNSPGQIGIHAF
jgi:hypothetical protein